MGTVRPKPLARIRKNVLGYLPCSPQNGCAREVFRQNGALGWAGRHSKLTLARHALCG